MKTLWAGKATWCPQMALGAQTHHQYHYKRGDLPYVTLNHKVRKFFLFPSFQILQILTRIGLPELANKKRRHAATVEFQISNA